MYIPDQKTGTFYFSDRLARACGAIVEYLEGSLCSLINL